MIKWGATLEKPVAFYVTRNHDTVTVTVDIFYEASPVTFPTAADNGEYIARQECACGRMPFYNCTGVRGNGSVHVHKRALLLAAPPLLARGRRRWRADALWHAEARANAVQTACEMFPVAYKGVHESPAESI